MDQIRVLQAVRGVACLAVVVHHVGLFSPGWAGVDLFFVLSGFVITWTQGKHVGRPAALLPYWGRRLWRIYPPYWIYWLATAIALRLANDVPFGNSSGLQRCINQLMLWPWKWGYHYLPVAWSLSYEVLFYLMFGMFVVAPKRWFIPLLATWTAVVAVKTLWLPPPPVTVLPTWLPVAPLVLEFLAGCWAAVALRRTSAGAGACLGIGLAGIVGGLTLLRAGLGFDVAPLSAWRAVALAPPIGLVVYGLTALERAGRLRPPRWLCRIGDGSYSIYLIHTAIGVMVAGAFLRRGVWPMPTYAAVLLAAGEVAVGYCCYLGVERPLLRLAQPAAGRRGPVRAQGTEEPAARAA